MSTHLVRRHVLPALLASGLVAGFVLASCGSDDSTFNNSSFDGGGNDGTAGNDGANVDGNLLGDSANQGDAAPSNYPCPGCPPFPVPGGNQCPPNVLGAATIAYPTDGLLLPPNMNVLEVQFVPPQGATLFEVDFENAITDVRVETKCNPVPDTRGGPSKGCGVTLPQAAWNDIANKNRDGDPVHVIVRSTIDGSCATSSTAKIDINFAKEDLAGGIYYWQSATYMGVAGTTGGIYSHDFGTFDPTPTPFYVAGTGGTDGGGTGTCVGCHNLSRDGARVSLATDDPDADDEFGDVHTHVLDVGTRTVLGGKNTSPGFQTWTSDHTQVILSTFKTSMNTAFAVFDDAGNTLIKNNVLPNNMKATQPDLSKDDATLVFTVPASGTISMQGDHHFFGGSLWSASYDKGSATLSNYMEFLHSDGTRNYYYPTIAPTGTFVMFNDAPQPGNTDTSNNDAFYNRQARVKLIHYPPQAGDQPIDLPNLNVADGLTNSWPRWSPFVQTYKGHKILWVTFSSNRDYGLHVTNKGFDSLYPPEGPAYDIPQPGSKQGVTFGTAAQPQIWMAAIVVDDDRALDAMDRSYPAFWLPFQDVNSHNHSAQWVEKVLNPPPPPQGDAGADGGTCSEENGSCQNATCCSDVVCCQGVCQSICIK